LFEVDAPESLPALDEGWKKLGALDTEDYRFFDVPSGHRLAA
jgi:hypothetical protein